MDCELPHGGSGMVAVVWGQSCSSLPGLPLLLHSPTWAEKFLNWPADPIPSALLDPRYFHRASSGTEINSPTPALVFRSLELALNNWTQ